MVRLPIPIDIFGVRFLTGPSEYIRTYVYPIMTATCAPPENYYPVSDVPIRKRNWGSNPEAELGVAKQPAVLATRKAPLPPPPPVSKVTESAPLSPPAPAPPAAPAGPY